MNDQGRSLCRAHFEKNSMLVVGIFKQNQEDKLITRKEVNGTNIPRVKSSGDRSITNLPRWKLIIFHKTLRPIGFSSRLN